jgi:hypothetical protein
VGYAIAAKLHNPGKRVVAVMVRCLAARLTPRVLFICVMHIGLHV